MDNTDLKTDHTVQGEEPSHAPADVPAVEQPAAESPVKITEKRRFAWLAILAMLFCVGAWVASTVNGVATVALGVVSILFGAFALGSHRAVVRNTAITFIIASAVLILVVGAFMMVLHKFLG